MAITATYKTFKNAYLKIERVWGSKSEGWNAWVAVYKNETAPKSEETLHVNVPYSEESPFKLIYNQLKTFSCLSDITDHFSVAAVPTEVDSNMSNIVEGLTSVFEKLKDEEEQRKKYAPEQVEEVVVKTKLPRKKKSNA